MHGTICHCREQFLIQPRDHWYEDFLEDVPEVFVGTSNRLLSIIRLLCTAMHLSFRLQKLPTPLWRQSEAVERKWDPQEVGRPS